ncbi:MAG: FAD binding domain-containing protein [Actinomycetota bacterium]
MPLVADYFRPDSLDEAATLLAGPGRRALAGGTVVVPEARRPTDDGVGLVDLQALGLDAVDVHPEHADIGAMVRLGDLANDGRLPDLLRALARQELPSALRNQATIGGTVALGEADSVLLAGLLVHGAGVRVHGGEELPLAAVLEAGVGTRLLTGVTMMTTGVGAIVATGRTPADVPIVAAVARRDGDGDGDVMLALTGVAPTPVLVNPADPVAGLAPTGDFRGSVDYRLHLAAILSTRALAEVSS